MNSKELVKTILTNLMEKKIEATPEEYAKEYIKISELHNIKIKSDVLSNELSDLLIEILTPVKSAPNEKKINKLLLELRENPYFIYKKEFLKNLKEAVFYKKTEELEQMQNSSKELFNITNATNKILTQSLEESKHINADIQEIKNIEDLDNTINQFQELVEKNQNSLEKNFKSFSEMESIIQKLQKDLEEANKEKAIDYLTKLPNRRYFDDMAEKFEGRFKRYNTDYAVVFLDIDHFKKINDSYGHEAGDKVLKTFASFLNKSKRQEDLLSRWGGEEFVILFNYNKIKELNDFINRIQKTINQSFFIINSDLKIQLTFSGGVSFRNINESLEKTIINADEELYKAKNSGRNKVLFSNKTIN